MRVEVCTFMPDAETQPAPFTYVLTIVVSCFSTLFYLLEMDMIFGSSLLVPRSCARPTFQSELFTLLLVLELVSLKVDLHLEVEETLSTQSSFFKACALLLLPKLALLLICLLWIWALSCTTVAGAFENLPAIYWSSSYSSKPWSQR